MEIPHTHTPQRPAPAPAAGSGPAAAGRGGSSLRAAGSRPPARCDSAIYRQRRAAAAPPSTKRGRGCSPPRPQRPPAPSAASPPPSAEDRAQTRPEERSERFQPMVRSRVPPEPGLSVRGAHSSRRVLLAHGPAPPVRARDLGPLTRGWFGWKIAECFPYEA